MPAASTLTHCGQLGGFGLDRPCTGWDVYDTYQVQFTATQTFSNVLGAAQMVVVAEAGLTHIEDMPDKLTGGPERTRPALQRPGHQRQRQLRAARPALPDAVRRRTALR